MSNKKKPKTKISEWRELREKLADIEHQRWSDWQKYCHNVLRDNFCSSKLERVLKRWEKQIATDYIDLSEKEKDSDREQVDRYLSIIQDLLIEVLEGVRLEKKNETIIPHDIDPEMERLKFGRLMEQGGFNDAARETNQTIDKLIKEIKL